MSINIKTFYSKKKLNYIVTHEPQMTLENNINYSRSLPI